MKIIIAAFFLMFLAGSGECDDDFIVLSPILGSEMQEEQGIYDDTQSSGEGEIDNQGNPASPQTPLEDNSSDPAGQGEDSASDQRVGTTMPIPIPNKDVAQQDKQENNQSSDTIQNNINPDQHQERFQDTNKLNENYHQRTQATEVQSFDREDRTQKVFKNNNQDFDVGLEQKSASAKTKEQTQSADIGKKLSVSPLNIFILVAVIAATIGAIVYLLPR